MRGDGGRLGGIGREDAVRIVEEELDREYRKSSGPGVDPVTRVVVARVEAHELVWLVFCQSEEFVRTGDHRLMLIGNGPYLVDRVDGGLHVIGAASMADGEWETDYRVRVRGLAVRTAVDDLHDEIRELAAAQGRIRAVRGLRQRLPVLSPAQALQYVHGLLDDDLPAHLVAVAVERLGVPVDPVLAVRTIRPGGSVSR
ncbi:YrhB domain-containing protein [Streptomyces sp. NPDC047042]|uniref:YrhB domain-containing protein n=1 Tax=Streptomyces sp. NPDC047042 TaxID=3154807 RepID=UPI0033DBAE33